MNFCKCGCGQKVSKNWATGHHRRGTTFTLSEESRNKIRKAQTENNSMKGKKSWNSGKTGLFSEEARTKIREARAKQVFSIESQKKRSESMKRRWSDGSRRREDCPFFIDGRHSGKTPIKQSYDYKMWRKAVFERDDYTCQFCKQRGGELQADHIKPQSVFPELRFDISNGRTLCRPCHQKTPTWGLRHWNNKRKTTHLALGVIA